MKTKDEKYMQEAYFLYGLIIGIAVGAVLVGMFGGTEGPAPEVEPIECESCEVRAQSDGFYFRCDKDNTSFCEDVVEFMTEYYQED